MSCLACCQLVDIVCTEGDPHYVKRCELQTLAFFEDTILAKSALSRYPFDPAHLRKVSANLFRSSCDICCLVLKGRICVVDNGTPLKLSGCNSLLCRDVLHKSDDFVHGDFSFRILVHKVERDATQLFRNIEKLLELTQGLLHSLFLLSIFVSRSECPYLAFSKFSPDPR